MRRFSVRPTLTLRGRTFHGLRGWSGKPMHPPLTDIPIAAYVFGAAFDVISVAGGSDEPWAREFWHAGTYVFVGGVAVSVLAAITGLWDAWKSSEAGTQARRTINTHASVMVMVTVLAIIDVVWRLSDYSAARLVATGHRRPVRRHRPAGVVGCDVRWDPGLRLRVQRGDGRRLARVAQVRTRPAAQRPRLTRDDPAALTPPILIDHNRCR